MKQNIRKAIKSMTVIFFGALLLTRARSSADAVRDAVRLCAGTVAPSTFPFLTLTAYVSSSGMLSYAGRPFDRLSRKIFRLPGEAFCIFLMSMTGGFPVGEKMIASALESGTISGEQAKRMALFCVGGGPAFVINTVGVFMLGSAKAGIILLASLILSAAVTGFLTGFSARENMPDAIFIKNDKAENALVNSVGDSIKAMINICGWIIVFNSFGGLVSSLIPRSAVPYFAMIAEVTNGCRVSAGSFPLPLTACVLGFGGLCVHCQVLPYLQKIGVRYAAFLCARVFNAAFGAAVSFFLFKLFPCETPVFAQEGQIVPVAWSVSFPASAAFLLTVSLIILELATKQKV